MIISDYGTRGMRANCEYCIVILKMKFLLEIKFYGHMDQNLWLVSKYLSIELISSDL